MCLNKVVIVLVNYRQAELTLECVRSLQKMENKAWHAVIVDNDSQDGSYERLCQECSGCTVIQSGENNGFSSGCNIGIRYALEHNASYVMLLNNDTVVDPYLLDQLLEFSDDNTVTVPKMYYFDKPNTLWYAGGYIDKLKGAAFHFGENEIDDGRFDIRREVDFATGCCMLIPSKVLKRVPLMDEAYFLYFEDVDYSLSFSSNGIRILYCPEAKLWHKVSVSTGKNSKLMEYYVNRNRLYCLDKYRFSLVAKAYTRITRCIKYIRGKIKRTNESIIWKSYIDYRKGNMGKQSLK